MTTSESGVDIHMDLPMSVWLEHAIIPIGSEDHRTLVSQEPVGYIGYMTTKEVGAEIALLLQELCARTDGTTFILRIRAITLPRIILLRTTIHLMRSEGLALTNG